MSATIERKASGEGYFILQEGLSPFFITTHLFLSSHLEVGQKISDEMADSLRDEQQSLNCREQALAYLARREHTGLELRQKLLKKNYAERQITQTLDLLSQQNLLSEYRFAQSYILSRQRKNPEGKVLLRQRLLAKGVNREDAERALQEAFTEELLIEAVGKAYEVALRKDDAEVARQKLQKRGFTLSEIRFALERMDE
ncbi:regulatory protein RecX [Sphaerochaeta sp. PS]|uniref:regulatory protein RecX n=1 Tax=Sphaerochaeta sp. PS TaxID=3076336 RepID=UPI0028A53A78|nr:regulatory protein RecX [Sphaerochaeta sp. PS]MDT4761308.1 regulatory protein RecX [Sphaerochaeta sp. PS]